MESVLVIRHLFEDLRSFSVPEKEKSPSGGAVIVESRRLHD